MSTPDSLEADNQPLRAVIVLAAGGGTRMKSSKSKLLHEICGKSMLSFAVSAAAALDPQHLVVVVGDKRDQVISHLDSMSATCTIAVQEEQRGTGHAVECGLDAIDDLVGDVLVTYGDVPMLSGDTLRHLVATHRSASNDITVLSARVLDPSGYGRVVRKGELIERIVEHRDANDAERAIDEINSGIYMFDAQVLKRGLRSLETTNAQGELYLTDVIAFCNAEGGRVGALTTSDIWQVEGVNDRVQLARMAKEMNRRILDSWMRDGVTIIDPATTWIDIDVDLAPDVTLWPGTILQGATTVFEGASIGPDTTLTDVEVGRGASVVRTHGSFAVIGEGASVGPFSYLRPGTVLGTSGKIGAFVETKKATIKDGAKVPHLSYVGDATIDEDANIGAGTIFANYDGINKSHTHVGVNAFVGSNSVLVAPVDVGDGAFVAAGSTITEDVAPGDLGVARGRQHASSGWIRAKRPGSAWAKAAEAAQEQPHPAVKQSREDNARA